MSAKHLDEDDGNAGFDLRRMTKSPFETAKRPRFGGLYAVVVGKMESEQRLLQVRTAEAFAVQRTEAVFPNRFPMLLGSVPFVLLKIV